MNFGVSWCFTWYCTAYLQIGGLLEATAPIGIIFALWLTWRAVRRI